MSVCGIVEHPAVGDPTVTISNPGYVAAIPGYFTTETNPDYVPMVHGYWGHEVNPDFVPATDGYFVTVANPDFVPAVDAVPTILHKWVWSGGGNWDGVIPSPLDRPDLWTNAGVTNDSKGSLTDAVFQQGNGNGSWFYFQTVQVGHEGTPAVGEPTVDVWVDGVPAQGEPTMIVWHEGHAAVGEPTILMWHEGVPAVGEEFLTVSNPGFVAAWSEQVECAPVNAVVSWPTVGEPAQIVPAVTVTEAVTEIPVPTSRPDELAVTGGDMLAPVLLAAVAVTAGIALLTRRIKRA